MLYQRPYGVAAGDVARGRARVDLGFEASRPHLGRSLAVEAPALADATLEDLGAPTVPASDEGGHMGGSPA